MLTHCLFSDQRRRRIKIILAFGAIYLIWGSTYLAIRFAVETLPPFLMTGTRTFVAGILLFCMTPRSQILRLKPIHWRSAAFTGAFLFLGSHGLVGWAEQKTYSSAAALILATIPCWMVIIRCFSGSFVPTSKIFIGLVLGLCGVAVIVFPSLLAEKVFLQPVYIIALIASAIFWATGSLYGRQAPLPDNPGLSSAMQLLCGGGFLLLMAFFSGEFHHFDPSRVTSRSMLSLIYLIVFGTLITFTAYTWLLREIEPAIVGSYAFVNPVIAVLLGCLVGGESLDFCTILGGMIIVTSITLIQLYSKSSDVSCVLSCSSQEMKS
ncbi:MAG: EamA family transporter [Planctomycetota bacterium]|jgi:drug/metabolite transporter (DMT)-like permease